MVYWSRLPSFNTIYLEWFWHLGLVLEPPLLLVYLPPPPFTHTHTQTPIHTPLTAPSCVLGSNHWITERECKGHLVCWTCRCTSWLNTAGHGRGPEGWTAKSRQGHHSWFTDNQILSILSGRKWRYLLDTDKMAEPGQPAFLRLELFSGCWSAVVLVTSELQWYYTYNIGIICTNIISI